MPPIPHTDHTRNNPSHHHRHNADCTHNDRPAFKTLWKSPSSNEPLQETTLYSLPSARVRSGEQVRPEGLVRFLRLTKGDAPCTGRISSIFCGARADGYAHIQRARRSQLVGEGEYLLEDGKCFTVPIRNVLHGVDGYVQWVFGNGVWRDSIEAKRVSPRDLDWFGDPMPTTSCDSCLSRLSELQHNTPVFSLDPPFGFQFQGNTYHVGDIAFFPSGSGGKSGREAQEVGIVVDVSLRELRTAPRVVVRRCGRIADLDGVKGRFVSERSVYMTDVYKKRFVSDIVGKALVNAPFPPRLDSLDLVCVDRLPRDAPLSFNSLVGVPLEARHCCDECGARELEDDVQKLRPSCADIYAGGGGSVLGAAQHFEVLHAVDNCPKSAATLRRNRREFFPRLRVHELKVSKLQFARGRPRPGDIALLIAAPPCQGHTQANHYRGRHDERNDEVDVMLGEIARIGAPVVLIENVPGIKDAIGGGNYAIHIVEALLRLKYQVRFGILNAQDYGSPQVRHRAFFLAVRKGLPLPSFPKPTHASNFPRRTLLRVDGSDKEWSLFPDHGSAPFKTVDARASSSDLPEWDYENWPRDRNNPYHPARREVGRSPVAYIHRPRNDLQDRLRRTRRGTAKEVVDHLTPSCARSELELILSAPDIRDDEQPDGKSRRAHPHGPIWTLLTTSRVGGKSTAAIHWGCQRRFTVAERKRFQGFPDTYSFSGSIADADRQIGNAIHVDVAAALAGQILRQVFAPAWRAAGKPGIDVFWEGFKQSMRQ